MKRIALVFCLMLSLSSVAMAQTGELFSKTVGAVTPKAVSTAKPVKVPYLTWGGDVPAFAANGLSLRTKPGSTYAAAGLDLQFVNGDNFTQQVRDYVGGNPYLRGTFQQLGLASEVIGQNSDLKPVVIAQLSYSMGDHVVGRDNVKTLNDLKGKTICLQRNGPHVGLIQDVLETINLSWSDVKVIWADDLSGKKGPASLFKTNSAIDLCCVITPDMLGLCSGLDQTGSGAEGTVRGAHVVVSTASMNRSVADVWAVQSGYYRTNRADVEKFVAGYFKHTDELIKLRNEFESGMTKGKFTGASGQQYRNILAFSQKTFNDDAKDNIFPTLEVDTHGLLLDCTFVGLPGNVSFFLDPGNLNGFDHKQKRALDLAVGQGYAKERFGFSPPGLDYRKLATLAGLPYQELKKTERIDAESLTISPDDEGLDGRTIASFTINFQPNQTDFSADTYGADFRRAAQAASTFGNSVILLRGHADCNKVLADLVKAGMAKSVIKRTKVNDVFQYYLNNQPLDLSQTKLIEELVKGGAFDGADPNPRETYQAALSLSQIRARAVKDSLEKFAKEAKINLDLSQIQPVGVGISEPLIARPKSPEDSLKNMRVEFRIIKVPAESVKSSDYDF